MFKLNLKIALRNLWKNKGITAINVGGLAIALAAFILVVIYVTFETTYDAENEHYDDIYIVGRNFPDFKTNFTAPPMARDLKTGFPEIVRVAQTKNISYEFPLSSDTGRIYSSNSIQMDMEAARMFNIQPDGGLVEPKGQFGEMYLQRTQKNILFPNSPDGTSQTLMVGSRALGMTQEMRGTINRDNSHSNIDFDLLALWKQLGEDEGYGHNNYHTYIQVKPGTDIAALTSKIDAMYKQKMIASGVDKEDAQMKLSSAIFLDPLKNLHLKPIAGTDSNYKIVLILSVLGLLILIIACINFTNLSIAQANKRAKEVGVRKVMGAYRHSLTIQFLTEIFIQCAVAMTLGLIIAEITMPLFNMLVGGQLSIFTSGGSLIWQLPMILIVITVISGLYPALVLSGFRPAYVLKGNLQTSYKTQWLRNALLIVQFGIAVAFIVGLLVVNSQLKYMHSENPGFSPSQVVAIKNGSIFNDPKVFEPVRERIKAIPGVLNATVATNIPSGGAGGSNSYSVNGKEELLKFIDVDFEYFETLNIKAAEGRLFSTSFMADTASSAILNESAVKKYGLTHPVGQVIRLRNTAYTIVGVIRDFKIQGFEKATEPTIYAIKNPSGNYKLSVMVKIDERHMADALAALKAKWPEINPKDGEDFRYDFLDELYGKLFKKQEQLRVVFFAAAMLTIFIAVLGLFAFAAFSIANRIKEISVRKILGATDIQILKLLNGGFLKLVLIANVLAFPVVYVLASKWLDSFAYRIDMPAWPFIFGGLISVCLALLTVSLQATTAVRANPVDALKYE